MANGLGWDNPNHARWYSKDAELERQKAQQEEDARKVRVGEIETPASPAFGNDTIQLPADNPTAGFVPQTPITLKTSTYASPEYSKEEAKIKLGLMNQQAGIVNEAGGAQQENIQRRMNYNSRMAEDAEKMRAFYGQRAEHLAGQLEEADRKVLSIQDRIDKAEIDPERTLRDMPATGQAIMFLAMGLARYSTMGTEGAVNILNSQIQRDTAIQKERLDRMLASRDFTERQRNLIENRWSVIAQQKAQAAKDVATHTLAAFADQTEKTSTRLKVAEVVNKIGQEQVDVLKGTRSKGTTTHRQVLPKEEVLQKKQEKVFAIANEAKGLADHIKDLDNLEKEIKKVGYSPVAADAQRLPVVGTIAKATGLNQSKLLRSKFTNLHLNAKKTISGSQSSITAGGERDLDIALEGADDIGEAEMLNRVRQSKDRLSHRLNLMENTYNITNYSKELGGRKAGQ